ncbi:unnamed protein product [marine sediment metagenome]|uniref:Uncharacterized protein n=1 Tax=marine sediment metagenome TaxID=412755 RepID=X1SYN8_9ZZZZ
MKPVCNVCEKEFVEGYLVIRKLNAEEVKVSAKKQKVIFLCQDCAYIEKKKFEEGVSEESG